MWWGGALLALHFGSLDSLPKALSTIASLGFVFLSSVSAIAFYRFTFTALISIHEGELIFSPSVVRKTKICMTEIVGIEIMDSTIAIMTSANRIVLNKKAFDPCDWATLSDELRAKWIQVLPTRR